MSTTTYDAPLSPRTADHGRDHRPGLVQLTKVELRKMCDTRAGFWLLLSGLLLCVATALISVLTGDDDVHRLSDVMDNCTQAINILLPIVGILLVTSEWSQRTALLTFTMVPQRGRVLVAKILASLALAVAAMVAAFVVSLAATALNPSDVDAWSISGSVLAQSLLFNVLAMLIGVGLGAAILLSAPAIVASFVLPLAYSAITHLISGLESFGRWTDQGEAYAPLTDHVLNGTEWARVLTASLVWVGIPMSIGAWRFLRGEIR